MGRSTLYPGLLAGSAIGVLSSLPFVNLANCCCLWIFGGGMLASYLCQQQQDEPITVSDALSVGAVAAVAGAVVGSIVSIPVHYLTAPIMQQLLLRVVESSQDVPADVRDMLENVSLSGAGLFVSFLFSLVLYMFFVPAGALVGALLFQKKPAAAFPPRTSGAAAPQPPHLPPPAVSADDDEPRSPGPADPDASRSSWEEAPPPPDPAVRSAEFPALVEPPAVDVPHAGPSTPASEVADDDEDDDDLPPSSAPPGQPPPLPTV